MKNPNQKNFLYSFLSFILVNVVLSVNPLYEIREMVFSSQHLKGFRAELLFSNFYSVFEQIANSDMIIVFILLITTLYFAIKYIRKEPRDIINESRGKEIIVIDREQGTLQGVVQPVTENIYSIKNKEHKHYRLLFYQNLEEIL